jgi:pantetheine-phosphate adenylyltransferase
MKRRICQKTLRPARKEEWRRQGELASCEPWQNRKGLGNGRGYSSLRLALTSDDKLYRLDFDMKRVVLPGTFDPPTFGHIDVIKRAAHIFDRIELVIAVNPEKKTVFTPEERLAMLKELVAGFPNVAVHLWKGLIVDFAKKVGANVILRGVRALIDFNYEFELSLMNKALNPEIETILLPTDQKYFVLRSSAIKEVAGFHGDISGMVPPLVEMALKSKLKSY